MKRSFSLAACCLASLLAACSSAGTQDANSNAPDLVNSANTQAANAPQPPQAGMTNGGTTEVIPGLNAPPDGKPVRADQPGTNPAATSNIVPRKLPAPDDSEFTTVLSDVGLETRTFKNHRQINKVERITSPKRTVIKVHLKSGKVVELPGDKIKNLRSAPVSAILAAAGLPTPTPPPGVPGETKDLASDSAGD